MEKCWIYKGKCLYDPPEGFYGYIYVITDNTGKKYYGKKAFTHRKKTNYQKGKGWNKKELKYLLLILVG